MTSWRVVVFLLQHDQNIAENAIIDSRKPAHTTGRISKRMVSHSLPSPKTGLRRFPFLSWPLLANNELMARLKNADSTLLAHLARSTFSIRFLRYWWAGQAIAEEARRQGRALHVLDVGCERGWLKYFTPSEAVEKWVGLDWDLRQEVRENACYDEVIRANFDEPLPVESGSMDVVVNNHVMEHLPRPGSTMAEISRVLRNGGIFLGGSPTMPHDAPLGRPGAGTLAAPQISQRSSGSRRAYQLPFPRTMEKSHEGNRAGARIRHRQPCRAL